MITRSDMRHCWRISFLVVVFSTKATFSQERCGTNTDQEGLKEIWKRVVEVNQVWLDPQPKSLSYKIVSGSPPPARPETTQWIWISGNHVRWEMESGLEPTFLEYTIISTPERTEYLRGPDTLLNKPIERRPLNRQRQGVTCYTATHALHKHGLPVGASLVSDVNDGANRFIVLETNIPGSCSVGLGLDHVFYGKSQRPIGRSKLTIRLPDYVPLREELADGTLIEYGPEFLKVGNGLAPSSLRHVSKLGNDKPWILSLEFQIIEGVWLLRTAQNLQDNVVIKQMDVQDVSTMPIPIERFAFPEKH